jgi:Domain of unknown function (DUF1996)/Domain of unknown function (DUF4124)
MRTQIISPTLYPLTLILMLFATNDNALAEVYRWKDNKGVMHYSDRAPASITSKNSDSILLKIIKSDNYCADPAPKNSPKDTVVGLNSYGMFSRVQAKVAQIQAGRPATSSSGVVANVATKSSGPFKALGFNTVTNRTPFGVKVASIATLASLNTTGKQPNLPARSNIRPATPAATAIDTPPTVVATNTPSANSLAPSNGLMPVVDISKIPSGNAGFSTLRIKSASHDGVHKDNLGAFRTNCEITHFGNDDPIVYPGVKGAAHHHTFFGNTNANYASTSQTIKTTGNSSCSGGIANRTGYWIPSMIDTATGAPIKPFRGIIYYKSGLAVDDKIVPFPEGLKMIAGNQLAKTEAESTASYTCINESQNSFKDGKTILPCKKATTGRSTDGYIRLKVEFPQCWDGKNLDSPDHKSHMAHSAEDFVENLGTPNERWYKTANNCPKTHPIALPQVTEIFDFEVTDAVNGTNKWRLASDNYAANIRGGLSLHADWMNGWDQTIMSRIVKNCLNKSIDCGVDYLGDGQSLY